MPGTGLSHGYTTCESRVRHGGPSACDQLHALSLGHHIELRLTRSSRIALLWRPDLVALHVVSDLSIGLAYFSIPLAILLRPDFTVAGQWGPRPSELQRFVLTEKRAGLRPVGDIYRDVRAWYARDRGESTIRELLGLIDSASRRAAA